MSIIKPRRKLIVNREVQYDVLMYVGVFVISLFVLQIATAYFFLKQAQPVAESMSAMEFLTRFKVSFLVYQIVPLALSLIVGVYIFNRLTSRIAGPLYNLRKTLRKAREQEDGVVQIKLRENDYFKEEINDVNVILKNGSK